MLLSVSIDGGKPYEVKRGRTAEPRIHSHFWYLLCVRIPCVLCVEEEGYGMF